VRSPRLWIANGVRGRCAAMYPNAAEGHVHGRHERFRRAAAAGTKWTAAAIATTIAMCAPFSSVHASSLVFRAPSRAAARVSRSAPPALIGSLPPRAAPPCGAALATHRRPPPAPPAPVEQSTLLGLLTRAPFSCSLTRSWTGLGAPRPRAACRARARGRGARALPRGPAVRRRARRGGASRLAPARESGRAASVARCSSRTRTYSGQPPRSCAASRPARRPCACPRVEQRTGRGTRAAPPGEGAQRSSSASRLSRSSWLVARRGSARSAVLARPTSTASDSRLRSPPERPLSGYLRLLAGEQEASSSAARGWGSGRWRAARRPARSDPGRLRAKLLACWESSPRARVPGAQLARASSAGGERLDQRRLAGPLGPTATRAPPAPAKSVVEQHQRAASPASPRGTVAQLEDHRPERSGRRTRTRGCGRPLGRARCDRSSPAS